MFVLTTFAEFRLRHYLADIILATIKTGYDPVKPNKSILLCTLDLTTKIALVGGFAPRTGGMP